MRLEFESNVSTPSVNEHDAVDSVSENSSSHVQAILQDGIKAAQSGNRAEARHLLLRVTELEPRNENAWLWLASISEYPEELLIFLNNVLDVNPNNQRALEWMKATKSLLAKTFVQRGIDAMKEEQKGFAKQCFFQAVAHDDQNEMAWLWLASVSDLAEEKKSHLDKVLAIDPENNAARDALKSAHAEIAQGLAQKANDLAAVGKNDEARELLEEIFQKAPNLESAWLLKAHFTQSFDEKFKVFEKVLEINPNNENAQAAMDAFQTIMKAAAPSTDAVAVEDFSRETDAPEDFAPATESRNFAEEAKEETFEESAEESFQENNFVAEELRHAEELEEAEEEAEDNNPTQELELPPAFAESNPFEETAFVEEDEDVNEKVDAFFEALEEQRKPEETPNEFTEESAEVYEETEEIQQFAGEAEEEAPAAEFEETAVEYSGEESKEEESEEFSPRQSYDSEESSEEMTQFSEGVENDDFEIDAQPAMREDQSQTEEILEEIRHEESLETAHFDEEQAHEETSHQETSHEEAPQAEFSPSEEDSHETPQYQPEPYSYQNFSHIGEAVDAVDLAEESGETAQTEEEFHAETEDQFAPEQSFAEEVSEQPDFEEEAQTEAVYEQDATPEPAAKVQTETSLCPFCSSENEVQAFACGSCQAVLSLSDLEVLLSNNEANQVLLHQAVSRMELEKNVRPFDSDELLYLGIGYINLKNLRQGFAYLQEAAQMRPDDFLLNSQVNTLAIRVADIKKQEEAQEAQPKGRTILVVDDSATVRKLISGKLEKSGHEVVCAVDGLDALAKLNEIVPDLILLDITMPRMDGYQVCKLIRNNQATKDIPVVMISGKDGFFDKVRGRMAGTTGYITKPFGPETLMKALDAYIKNDGN